MDIHYSIFYLPCVYQACGMAQESEIQSVKEAETTWMNSVNITSY